MKKILFTILLAMAIGFMYGQTTYYWVGGTAFTSFTANGNWNTLLNGTGTTRAAAASTDILIFDGSNVGGTVPTTGTVNATATSTSCGQIKLQNGAMVNLGRSTAGSATITVSGDATAANDLTVDAGCTLTLGGTAYNYDVNITIAGTATALINGTVYLSPLSSSVHTRSYITAAGANSVMFASGSACYITDSTATSGFNASVQDGVRFLSGSSCYYYTGRSPIGSSSTLQFTNFDPGSNLYFMKSNVSYIDGVTAYSSSSWSNRKALGNVFIQNGASFTADGPSDKIDDLTIDAGCSFTTHTSGVTPILGNLTVNGTLNGPSGSSNTVVMGGNTPQTISGTGSIDLPALSVANYSDVTLSRTVNVLNSTDVFGKINFGATNQLTGPGTFTAKVNGTATSITGNTVAGSYRITNVTGTLTGNTGLTVTGNGLAANTNVTGFSSSNAVVLLSKPATATVTGATFTFSSDTSTMVTANVNGMDSLTGSVIVVGTKSYQSGTNYIINGATTKPFGISSGSAATSIYAGFVEINASTTINRSINIYNHLSVNGVLTLRPLDLVHVYPGAAITGTFSNAKYIAADYTSAGAQSMIEVDGISAATTIPIGTTAYYLPVTITPSGTSDFSIAAFTGITADGTITGTPLTATQKQLVVDAVWNINRLNGTGTATVQINWPAALEGATFTTLANTDIGLIKNNGTSWDLPIGTGNNTSNIVTGSVAAFGAFSAGAVPQTSPFIFNALPVKTYGNADFSGGATSLNTTQPIIYTSNNPAVAAIVAGNIHIVGAGSADITAAQASDGFYPAASITRTLTVNPASLTIKADDKTKFEGQANPALTATYTGFVLGETNAVLLTQPTLSTAATTGSVPGTYPITVTGATAANYSITQTDGVLTVQAKQNQVITFPAPAVKTYGNADFAHGVTSTNNTIPVTFTSSNPAVAIVTGNNIHIVGAGTTNITASQAGNVGYFPAADVTRTLTVNKASLAIKIKDTVRNFGTANPVFTITYTGFVLGETAANLTTPVSVATVATTNSAPGNYSITPQSATSSNYNITFTSGTLTVLPSTGTSSAYINAFMSNSTTLMVRLYSPNAALADIVLIDMEGRYLKRKNVFLPVGFTTAGIDVSALPSGTYMVRVVGSGINLVRKTLISK
ncbi:MAG: T9SS type A sorting domain-containing protein [Bacteroidetes bacterium]|nr:T9SS type A sorting domain-containing protein [Bacteroidota bacterium]